MPETASVTTTPHPSPAAMAASHRDSATPGCRASRTFTIRRVARGKWPRGGSVVEGQFAATQVTLFGSTVHGHWFSTTSDIDLAASGLASDDYFTAVARLQISLARVQSGSGRARTL